MIQSNTAERPTKFDSHVMTSVTFSTVARKNNMFSPEKLDRNQKDSDNTTNIFKKDDSNKIKNPSTKWSLGKSNADVDEVHKNDKCAKKKRKQKIMTIDLMNEFKNDSNQVASISCKNQG